MAPKSKPTSGSKTKSSSATNIARKKAISLSVKKNDKKIIQQSLKGRKPAVSPSAKEELLKSHKPAVSSSAKENHQGQLKKLQAENDALRKVLAAKEHVSTTIPRPEKGNAGKGFNLQEAMGLADDDETYALLRRSVRDLATQAGLDCSVMWYRQPKDVISKIIGAARQRHSYFKRFPHGWAIEEFLKTNLKNKRAYARKRGYLGDGTNRGVEIGKGNESGNDSDEVERSSDLDEGGDGAGRENLKGSEDDDINEDRGINEDDSIDEDREWPANASDNIDDNDDNDDNINNDDNIDDDVDCEGIY